MRSGSFCAGCHYEAEVHNTFGGKKFKHTCSKMKTKHVDITKRSKYNKDKALRIK